MKKLFCMVLILLLAAFTAAEAAPAMTDGTTTGWIVENNYLFFQGTDGTVRQLPIAIADLLGMSENELYCLAEDQRVIAVKKDHPESRIVDNVTPDSLWDQSLKLENGILTLNDAIISSTALAAACDGRFVCYVEKSGQLCLLRVRPVQSSGELIGPQSRSAGMLSLDGKTVSEPVSMTITKDAITLTGTDHIVTAFFWETGDSAEYLSVSDQTAAACLMDGILYRYTLDADGGWLLESAARVTIPSSATPTPAPTPTPTPSPTPRPTPVPTPVPTPTRAPAPTPTSLIDDDGTVHYGATGSIVRNIQKRLAELGYPTGKVDGSYGKNTQTAINLFCNAIHVSEHDYISYRVQRRLFAADAPAYDPYLALSKGDRGTSVLNMQKRLKDLGYDAGKLDGVYGENTVNAVAAFLDDYRIDPVDPANPGAAASRAMLEKLYTMAPAPKPVWKKELVTAYVTRLYKKGLNREPDDSGLNHFVDQIMNDELTPVQVAKSILVSPEMDLRSLSDNDFVRVAYLAMMNREPDDNGMAGWIELLNSGGTRTDVVTRMGKSEEFKKIVRNLKD